MFAVIFYVIHHIDYLQGIVLYDIIDVTSKIVEDLTGGGQQLATAFVPGQAVTPLVGCSGRCAVATGRLAASPSGYIGEFAHQNLCSHPKPIRRNPSTRIVRMTLLPTRRLPRHGQVKRHDTGAPTRRAGVAVPFLVRDLRP